MFAKPEINIFEYTLRADRICIRVCANLFGPLATLGAARLRLTSWTPRTLPPDPDQDPLGKASRGPDGGV
ncbi:hypothetical protein ACL02S_16290 [Nocardia sp. 004]|uniref:hypothetical protein n=1 Tax=Nocardia sp. 004 TaxID=3385978 RepID=UPI0039A29EE6